MQARLSAVKETREANTVQLAELKAQLELERALRPESVCVATTSPLVHLHAFFPWLYRMNASKP